MRGLNLLLRRPPRYFAAQPDSTQSLVEVPHRQCSESIGVYTASPFYWRRGVISPVHYSPRPVRGYPLNGTGCYVVGRVASDILTHRTAVLMCMPRRSARTAAGRSAARAGAVAGDSNVDAMTAEPGGQGMVGDWLARHEAREQPSCRAAVGVTERRRCGSGVVARSWRGWPAGVEVERVAARRLGTCVCHGS
jgi:hypothetical protein